MKTKIEAGKSLPKRTVEAWNMTYAEQTAATGKRDDLHMIYELGPTSQYEDGSALICTTLETYTREEAAAGIDAPSFGVSGIRISKDLRRNARAASRRGGPMHPYPPSGQYS